MLEKVPLPQKVWRVALPQDSGFALPGYIYIYILESTGAHSRALDSHALGIWEPRNQHTSFNSSRMQAQHMHQGITSFESIGQMKRKAEQEFVHEHKNRRPDNTHTSTHTKTAHNIPQSCTDQPPQQLGT